MTIEVMKQSGFALDILYEKHWMHWQEDDRSLASDAITALRQAISDQESNPIDEHFDKQRPSYSEKFGKPAISQPDCRGCKVFQGRSQQHIDVCATCTNGGKFQALPKVMLYKVTPQA